MGGSRMIRRKEKVPVLTMPPLFMKKGEKN